MGLLRDLPALPGGERLRFRLPRARGAGGVHRLRRPGRRDDRLLAQRGVDDGRPVLLGARPGQSGALLHRAYQPDEHPGGDGDRRAGDDQQPGAGGDRHREPALRGHLRHPRAVAAGRGLLAHHGPSLRDGDAVRQPLPALGPRGVSPRPATPGADLLPGRRELPAPPPGRPLGFRAGHAAACGRAGRHAPARLPRRRQPGCAAGGAGGRHPGRHDLPRGSAPRRLGRRRRLLRPQRLSDHLAAHRGEAAHGAHRSAAILRPAPAPPAPRAAPVRRDRGRRIVRLRRRRTTALRLCRGNQGRQPLLGNPPGRNEIPGRSSARAFQLVSSARCCD